MRGKPTRNGGIDTFRPVAAAMVVAIHTAPFSALAPVLDAAFTYGLFRVAVPFFFLCTGYFVRQGQGPHPVATQTRKLAVLYLAATLLYLPLSPGGGPFHPLDFLYRLLWQGTFYHLWYFPAAILGLWLAWLAFQYLPRTAGCVLMCTLYVIGLLGDNFLALLQGQAGLAAFAQGLVSFFGFTRNGIFFAAPFLYAGMALRVQSSVAKPIGKRDVAVLCTLCAALVGEALLLYAATGTMPQGSMYVVLPVVSIFLFRFLLRLRCKALPGVAGVATLVFLLHPWCIALLYAAAGRMGIPNAMQSHSGLFFLSTLAASVLLSVALQASMNIIHKARQAPKRAQAVVDLETLRQNHTALRQLLPESSDIMAVVKANAYGHGAVAIARALRRQNVRRFAVATLREGVQLRLHGIGGEILVLGYVAPGLAPLAFLFRITLTAVDKEHCHGLAASRLPLKVHLKIDTGMHRLGQPPDVDSIASLYRQSPLRIKGIYSHLATADSLAPDDVHFARQQAREFFTLVDSLRGQGIQPGSVHLQSSYGVLNHPDFTGRCTCVRIGLALYGATRPDTLLQPALRPVLTLRAGIAHLQDLPAGAYAGYSHAYQCRQSSRIAILALGYADGLPRNATGWEVLLRGQRARIVATCMDTCLLDITHLPGVRVNDEAIVLGCEAGEDAILHAYALADGCGTIPNEILSRIGPRVPRVYENKRGNA